MNIFNSYDFVAYSDDRYPTTTIRLVTNPVMTTTTPVLEVKLMVVEIQRRLPIYSLGEDGSY